MTQVHDDLHSPDPISRAAAAAAIGVTGAAGPGAVERLHWLVAADPDPVVRAAALAALSRTGDAAQADWDAAAADADAAVRRRATEVAPELALDVAPSLVALLGDHDALVAESAAFALGELSDDAIDAGAVETLSGVAREHPDAVVREAAVAALGALGHPGGLTAVLAAMGDRRAVRRRAVLALAAFDGPEVEAALARALGDRDWQVRQAAEDLQPRN